MDCPLIDFPRWAAFGRHDIKSAAGMGQIRHEGKEFAVRRCRDPEKAGAAGFRGMQHPLLTCIEISPDQFEGLDVGVISSIPDGVEQSAAVGRNRRVWPELVWSFEEYLCLTSFRIDA